MELKLLLGKPCPVPGICTLRPVTLAEIAEIGYGKVRERLAALLLQDERMPGLTALDVAFMAPDFLPDFLGALDFFCEETPKAESGAVSFGDAGTLAAANYAAFRRALAKSCGDSEESAEPETFASEKARLLFEKAQKYAAREGKGGPDIFGMAQAVAAAGAGYTLMNIGALTLFQLFALFKKLYGNYQHEFLHLRWAAWGKDSPDFSNFYRRA
jgi:hypothetical protein